MAKDLLRDILNLGDNARDFVANKVSQSRPVQYFNPVSNKGKNFWSSGVADQLAKTQRFVESADTAKPFETFVPNIPKPIRNIPVVGQTANFVRTVGINIGDTLAAGLLNDPINIGKTIGNIASGGIGSEYGQLKPGGMKAAYNLRSYVNPGFARDYKVESDFKGLLADIAEAAMPIASAHVGASMPALAKGAVKFGAKQGLKTGTGFAVLEGLRSGRNIKDNFEYAKHLAITTAIGAASGVLVGTSIPLLVRVGHKLVNITKASIKTRAVKNAIRESGGFLALKDKTIKTKNVNDLVPASDDIDRGQVAIYKSKIKKGEKLDPIYVTKSGDKFNIEDGKTKYQAFKESGFNEVPTVELVSHREITKSTALEISKKPDGKLKSNLRTKLDSRPLNQIEIEDAFNAGDNNKVKQLIAAMSDDDPYKGSMQSLFGDDIAEEAIVKPLVKTNDTSEIQEIRNSIIEGENILRTGMRSGRKISPTERIIVSKSVENARSKIGIESKRTMGGDDYKVQEFSFDELMNMGETNKAKPTVSQSVPVVNNASSVQPVPGSLAMPAQGPAVIPGITGSNGDSILSDAKKEITTAAKLESSRAADQTVVKGWKKFYTGFVNRFQPFEDVVDKIERETNSKIIPSQNPTYTVNQLLGAGGSARLRHQKKLTPILDMLDEFKIDKEDMDVFLKASRDIELSGRAGGILGSDAGLAQSRIDVLSQRYDPKILKDISNKFYSYLDEGLQMLRDSGFIHGAGYDSIKGANQSYVPFERVMDEVDNYLGLPAKTAMVGTQPINQIKGSERQIYSPIESIIADTYKIESAVARNRVATSLVNLRKVAPEYNDMFKVTDKSSSSTITVWEGGKKLYYEVGEDIANAAKGMNEESMGTVLKILSAPASLMRQGATGRNIDFMIPNAVKDQFDAAVASRYGYKPFIDYIRGLSHLIRYERTGSDEIMEGWLSSGGSMSFENLSGRKAVSEEILDATAKRSILGKLKNWVIGGLDTFGKYSETPTRLGLYQRAYENTGNTLLAAAESRDGTLDFARMGNKMVVINSIVPYFNVGVQGFDRMIRAAKENPAKFSINMTLYAALPATVTAVYNNLMYPEEYKEIAQYEKDVNLLIVTGRDDEGRPTFVTLPKGNIAPLIMNPVEDFVTYLAGNDPRSFKELAFNLFGDTLPILQGGDNFSQVASRTVGANLPQFIKPTIEDMTNYSFFKNRNIVSPYALNKPPEEQVKDNTASLYKYAGNVLGVSPLRVENFAVGTLAGYIKTPSNIYETLKNKAEGERVNINAVPVVSRFVGSGGLPEDTEKYRLRDEKRELEADLKNEGKPNLIQRILGIEPSSAASGTPNIAATKEVKLYAIDKGFTDYLKPNPYKDEDQAKKWETAKLKKAEQILNDVDPKITEQVKMNALKAMGVTIPGASSDADGQNMSDNTKVEEIPDIYSYWDGTDLKTIDFNKYKAKDSGNRTEAVKVKRDVYTKALQTYREDLPDGEKDKILSKLGVSREDMEYYDLASDVEEVRRTVVDTAVEGSGNDRKTLMLDLSNLKQEVNGKAILTNGIIDDLYKEELITKPERNYLKSITYKGGKFAIKKSKSRKGSSGKKLAAALKQVLSSQPDLPKVNIDSSIGDNQDYQKVPGIQVDTLFKTKVPDVQPLSISQLISNSKKKNNISAEAFKAVNAVRGGGGTQKRTPMTFTKSRAGRR